MILLGTGRDGTRHLLRAQRPAHARTLERELSLPPPVARVLASRGVTEPSHGRAFLQGGGAPAHDPLSMTGMSEAVGRVLAAARDGACVVVVGDDDLDGVAGSVLLAGTLADAGARAVTVFERRRAAGPDPSSLGTVVARDGAVGVVTVDGAASSPASVASATAAGAWVVLTDHHGAWTAPPGSVLVDPSRPGCAYPFKGLSGAAVAWKLASAVASALPAGPRVPALERLERATALVALATLSDLSPLLDENRVLVSRGLSALSERPGPGLAALRALAGLGGHRSVSARQAVLRLVPRLNAAARLGRPDLAAALLSEEAPEAAARLASEVEAMNTLRRQARDRVLSDVRARLRASRGPDRESLVVESGSEESGWLRGVLGSAALALSAELRAPVLLLAEEGGLLHGSGRSRARVPLKSRLEPVARRFALSFGGHENAVGVVLPSGAYRGFRDAARSAFEAGTGGEEAVPVLVADTEILASEVVAALPASLATLGPHGPGNPRPIFLLRGVVPAGRCRSAGRDGRVLALEVGGRHLRAVAPGLTELRPSGAGSGRRDVLVRVLAGPGDGEPLLSVVGLAEAV